MNCRCDYDVSRHVCDDGRLKTLLPIKMIRCLINTSRYLHGSRKYEHRPKSTGNTYEGIQNTCPFPKNGINKETGHAC